MCEVLKQYLSDDPISIIRNYLSPSKDYWKLYHSLFIKVELDHYREYDEIKQHLIIQIKKTYDKLYKTPYVVNDLIDDERIIFNIEEPVRYEIYSLRPMQTFNSVKIDQNLFMNYLYKNDPAIRKYIDQERQQKENLLRSQISYLNIQKERRREQ